MGVALCSSSPSATSAPAPARAVQSLCHDAGQESTAWHRQWEIPVLQHYHATLLQRGVTDYTWAQLWDDYRLCVAMGIYIATEWCRGPHVDIWLPMLQRSLTAYDDLQCDALW